MRWSTCLVVIIGLIKCGAKLTWIESVASSDRHTFVVSGGMYISSLATGFGMCNLMDCPKDTIVSAVLPVIVPLDQSANVAFRAQALTHLGNQKCSAICSIADDYLKRHSDILVIVTTCNHIDATMDALSTLRDNSDKFDLVIIDDYSIDGTSDILIKHGYFVVQKNKGMGLTDSWNIGYRLARSLGYSKIIISNNDVFVPNGAIDGIAASLVYPEYPVVVPTTTRHACGHNPLQSIRNALNMSAPMALYAFTKSNFHKVQKGLSKYRSPNGLNNIIHSTWKNKVRFNGFFFGVHMQYIASSAYDGSNLFDPDATMVFQEDLLTARMFSQNLLLPVVNKYTFVYHEKSVTVKAAHYISGSNNETRNDISLYHPELQEHTRQREAILPRIFPELYDDYDKLVRHELVEVYPLARNRPVMRVAHIDDDLTSPFVEAFRKTMRDIFIIDVTATSQSVDGFSKFDYDLQNVDVLLIMTPTFDLRQIRRAMATLRIVLWLDSTVNHIEEWLVLPWIGNSDIILYSSTNDIDDLREMQDFPVACFVKCPQGVEHITANRRIVPVKYLHKDISSAPQQSEIEDICRKVVTMLADSLKFLIKSRLVGPNGRPMDVAIDDSDVSTLCVGVQLTHASVGAIETKLIDMMRQYKLSKRKIAVQLYIVNVDAVSRSLTAFMTNLVDHLNMMYGDTRIRVRLFLTDEQTFGLKHQTQFAPLQIRDDLLEYMKDPRTGCDWLLFSDLGDSSAFRQKWFDAIAEVIATIALDNVKTIRWVDLAGEVALQLAASQNPSDRDADSWMQSTSTRIVHRSIFVDHSSIAFLPDGMFTKMLFAREYMMNVAINSVLDAMGCKDAIAVVD